MFHLRCFIIGFVVAACSVPVDQGVSEGRILSAFYGLENLPFVAILPCEAWVEGQDGMPVTFSVRIDDHSLSESMFEITRGDGVKVTPRCATLRPATEPLERRTVLLAGDFGTVGMPPRSVEVIGSLLDDQGGILKGARIDWVTPLERGPKLVLAESYPATIPEFRRDCPADTGQILQLVFDGGVSGPEGAALSRPQREGIHVRLADGQVIRPLELSDDDPDNFVLACIGSETTAVGVIIDSDLFYDPGNDPNDTTQSPVIQGRW